jgi:UDPglucose 6-dehydrogenase
MRHAGACFLLTDKEIMKVAVIGTGYVGLVSGVCLAAHGGHQIICLSQSEEVVEQINRGIPPVQEKGLAELLRAEVHDTKRLRATKDIAQALEGTDLILVTVETPSDDQGRTDYRYLEEAVREIGGWFCRAQRSIPVVVKGTVLPGTTDTLVAGWLCESAGFSNKQLMLGVNPGALRAGKAVEDFMNPGRIVMGTWDPFTAWCLRDLYMRWNCDKLLTDLRTAEMTKFT